MNDDHGYTSESFAHRRKPSMDVARRDLWEKIRKLLTRRQYECVIGCIVDGRRQEDVAADLRVDQSTVAKCIGKALEVLRQHKPVVDDLRDVVADQEDAEPMELGLATKGVGRRDPLEHLYGRGCWNEGCRDDQ